MNKILKLYGLPRTGSTVAQWLLTLNFKNYVCDLAQHYTHFLGWKHGAPPNKKVIEAIKKYTDEQILFIFTSRNYYSWVKAIEKNRTDSEHQGGSWEFLNRFRNADICFYNTPVGIELYESYSDLYLQKQKIYQDFCSENDDISIMIDFHDLKFNQKDVVLSIKNKFNLELCYDEPIEIKKEVTTPSPGVSTGFRDYRNVCSQQGLNL